MNRPVEPLGFARPFPPPHTDVEDLRMAWRDACADLRVAYHAWRQQGPTGGGDAFAAYVAAADREAAAADTFARHALASSVAA